MGQPRVGAACTRWWFGVLIGISALLLALTLVSYALAGQGPLSRVLFWMGLGGENNIGAWWSGMLLALAACLTLDGCFDAGKSHGERRGWFSLGLALLLLSFDEVASLHEYLSGLGLKFLAVLGVVGLTLACYGMAQLRRARAPARTLGLLLLAFGLLASVPIHETLQNILAWRDPVIYGVRAVLEEGTEIVAMLIFVWVAHANAAALLRSSGDGLVAPVHWRRHILLAAVLLWPTLNAATFLLPAPGGPADWLASTLLLACALLVVRTSMLEGELDSRALALIAFYLAASAAANAVSFKWDPFVLGTPVSLRGIVFAVLCVNAALLLRANGRRIHLPRPLLVAALVGISAIVWPSSQALWCALPSAFALWLYSIESKLATVAARMRVEPLPAEVVRS